MKNKIYEFLKMIIKYGSNGNIELGDTLIVQLAEYDNDVIECFKLIKDEFKLREIIFIDKNYKELYYLLKDTEFDKISKLVPKININSNEKNTTVIMAYDNSIFSYENKLYREETIEDKYNEYIETDLDINSKYYNLLEKCNYIIVAFPSNEWSKQLSIKKDMLWSSLFKTTYLNKDELNEEREKLDYLTKYLNALKIKELYFNNRLGTDLKIGLSNYSRFVTSYDNEFTNKIGYTFNFPSYEIYTAPNMYLAEGKVVVSHQTHFQGIDFLNSSIEFKNGKVESILNNQNNDIIMNQINNLNRIGEIALVSSDSPIARLNQNFNNLLLDENAGCHLALGDSLDECFDIRDKENKQNYNFNASEYHCDIVFGTPDINVECKTSTGKKKVLINNGKWVL